MCTAAASYIGDLFRRPGLSSRALILRRDLIFTNAKRGETPLPAAVVSRGIGCVLCSQRQRRPKLAYVYFEEEPGRRSRGGSRSAKVRQGGLLQELLRRKDKGLIMALADMEWTKISIHHVVLEFLRGEQKTTKFPTPADWQPVIDNPDLSGPLENQKRLRLLYIPRAEFMIEIPADTTWWEVHSLTENELGELYVSAKHNPDWDGPGNRLERVAAAIPVISLDAPPSAWPGRIILWGHDREGPFSIMEGNHRMLAYAQAALRPPIKLDVYVGLSPSYCYWHHADPNFCVGTDLFSRERVFSRVNNWWWRVR